MILLNSEGKKEFLKSTFHRYFDIELSIPNLETPNFDQFVNFTLHKQTIVDYLQTNGIETDSIFNESNTNVIFTPQENQNQIYDYEYFEGIYYIKLKPFSEKIRLHIIPKKYNASDLSKVLLLKKSKIIKPSGSDHPNFFVDSFDNPDFDDVYHLSEEYSRIDENNYKQINLQYEPDTLQESYGFYRFDLEMNKRKKELTNVQINVGYSYNDTNPSNDFNHFIGIFNRSDSEGHTTNNVTEFNSVLVNRVDHKESSSNEANDYIVQLTPHVLDNNEYNPFKYGIYETMPWVKSDGSPNIPMVKPENNGMIVSYAKNQLYHKTLKYFNDTLYVEQDGDYYIQNWDSDLTW